MVQAYAGLPDHLTPAGSLMTLLDVLGGLVTTSGVLAGLLGREQDGRGRRVRSSLLCSAALLQTQLGERELNGRPEFGAFGMPLPALDGDLWAATPDPPGPLRLRSSARHGRSPSEPADPAPASPATPVSHVPRSQRGHMDAYSRSSS